MKVYVDNFSGTTFSMTADGQTVILPEGNHHFYASSVFILGQQYSQSATPLAPSDCYIRVDSGGPSATMAMGEGGMFWGGFGLGAFFSFLIIVVRIAYSIQKKGSWK